nr:MAG TPA: antitoxin [Cressdnaviricota sp.]
MPSDKPKIVIRTEQETIDKLDIIAKEQNRSRANLAEYILKDFISKYEKENGRINNSKLSVSKIS